MAAMVSIADARRQGLIPAGIHVATISRWILRGVKDRTGRVVRLRASRVGARWFVTPEDVQHFIDATTSIPEDDTTTGPAPRPRSASSREKAAAAAEKKLIEMGC